MFKQPALTNLTRRKCLSPDMTSAVMVSYGVTNDWNLVMNGQSKNFNNICENFIK